VSRLTTFLNVVITAYRGYFTRKALEQNATMPLGSIADFERGLPLTHEIK
jgi:phosphoglycerate dehydrogenase-like enzyme